MPYIVKDKVEFLNEAGKILSSSLDYNVTLASIASLTVSNIADFCLIDVLENNSLKRVAVRISNPKLQDKANEMYDFFPDPRNKKAIYDAVKLGSPILIKNVTPKWLRSVSKIKRERDLVKEFKLNSFIFAPLKSRGEILGVLTVGISNENFSYTEEDAIFLEELASRAGISVDKAKLFSEAQEAIRIRDEFLSIASHELKTPLTSILLNLQAMLKKLKSTPNSEINKESLIKMIELSENQSKKLSKLINDLLNISVTASGRLEIEKEEVNLNALIKEEIAKFEIQLKKSKQKIKLIQNDKIIGKWDKTRIDQVITNLISNAIKYGGNKPIEIIISKRDDFAIIEIKDQGIGIKKEYVSKIFDRFVRAVQGTDIKGLGVGLYISKHIVEAHDGSIFVESVEGKGSKFTIELPIL